MYAMYAMYAMYDHEAKMQSETPNFPMTVKRCQTNAKLALRTIQLMNR